MAKNQDQRNRERDKRLQKNYRWTLERRNRLSEKQGHKCGICGRPESYFTQPLQLDHEHFRIVTLRVLDCVPADGEEGKTIAWMATAVFKTQDSITAEGKTQKAAIAAVRELALPKSVRGLLCPGRYTGCNRLLGRVDNIEWMECALSYLKNPPAKGIK